MPRATVHPPASPDRTAQAPGSVWPGGLPPASLLYVPASNRAAIGKVATRGAEAFILDLEDGVAPANRAAARASLAALLTGPDAPLGSLAATGRLWIRPSIDSDDSGADLTVIGALPASCRFGLVIPKVEQAGQLQSFARTGRPLLAMIETPRGVLDAHAIATADHVVGLVAGLNDLAHALRLPVDAMRTGTMTALSQMVIAARAADIAIFDGVWNAFGDVDGFAADTAVGRSLGCDGRTLIHPAQVRPCHAVYGPGAAEIALAEQMLLGAPANGGAGAVRVGDTMVEDMHRDQARAVLAAARARGLYHRD